MTLPEGTSACCPSPDVEPSKSLPSTDSVLSFALARLTEFHDQLSPTHPTQGKYPLLTASGSEVLLPNPRLAPQVKGGLMGLSPSPVGS